MNLFNKLSPDLIEHYVTEVETTMQKDVLVQNPEELGRWLALMTSYFNKENFTYLEIGVSVGGTFRLTRKILQEKYKKVDCFAIDDGSDMGFKGFLKWMEETPSDVYLFQIDVDDPNIINNEDIRSLSLVDACFLDAAHTYKSTWNAFRLAERVIREKGLMAFHDTDEPRALDVGKAIKDICTQTDWVSIAYHSTQFGLTVLGNNVDVSTSGS